MVKLTTQLIRRKAEHHDGTLADLEELSLHQMELERIEAVGTACRKLKILYLQNNIINRLENLHHLKDLNYLNMALNNITKIEGLGSCEFLSKLDLTANFVDVDELESSMEHLRPLLHLKEIFLMGCPFQDWEHSRDFVIVSLPQLQTYDGTEIMRSDRIKAQQKFKEMREELRVLANAKRLEKGLEPIDYEAKVAEEDDEDASPWTPEERTRMYREMAEQKAEKEKDRAHMEPKKRDYELEQQKALDRARAKEEAGEIRQCNEGRWDFTLLDEDGEGNVVLTIPLPRFLDNSLLHVDCHPTYVTIIIKGKVLRLRFPEEVGSDAGTAQRSATSGELVIKCPKIAPSRFRRAALGPSSTAGAATGAGSAAPPHSQTGAPKAGNASRPSRALRTAKNTAEISERTKRFTAPKKMGDVLMEEALAAAGKGTPALTDGGAGSSKASAEVFDDSDVPPLE